MSILLDTNALIWWLQDDKQLGPRARADLAEPSRRIFISSLSLFEFAIKARTGKLRYDLRKLELTIIDSNFTLLAFDGYAAQQFVTQAALPQSDPFDTGLAAQAIAKRLTLMTADQQLLDAMLDGLHLQDARH